jgi:hypothetical protein
MDMNMDKPEALKRIEEISAIIEDNSTVIFNGAIFIAFGIWLCVDQLIEYWTYNFSFNVSFLPRHYAEALFKLPYFAFMMYIFRRICIGKARKELISEVSSVIRKALSFYSVIFFCILFTPFALLLANAGVVMLSLNYMFTGILLNVYSKFNKNIFKYVSWSYIIAGLLQLYLIQFPFYWIYPVLFAFCFYLGATLILLGITQLNVNRKKEKKFFCKNMKDEIIEKSNALKKVEEISFIVEDSNEILLSGSLQIIVGVWILLIPVFNTLVDYLSKLICFLPGYATNAVAYLIYFIASFCIIRKLQLKKKLNSGTSPIIRKIFSVYGAFIVCITGLPFVIYLNDGGQFVLPILYLFIGLWVNLISNFTIKLYKYFSWSYIIFGLVQISLANSVYNSYLYFIFVIYMGLSFILLGFYQLRIKKFNSL